MKRGIKWAVVVVCLTGHSNAFAQTATSATGENQAQGLSNSAANNAAPQFLTADYAPVFEIGTANLQFVDHRQNNNVDQYEYTTSDQAIDLIIDRLPCAGDACKVAYNNALRSTNQQVTSGSGKFQAITDSEYRAEWKDGSTDKNVFLFRLPASLVAWTYSDRSTDIFPSDDYFGKILFLANRQRYDEALASGNVEMAAGMYNPENMPMNY